MKDEKDKGRERGRKIGPDLPRPVSSPQPWDACGRAHKERGEERQAE